MSTLLFLVLTELSPGVAILVLNGVFLIQTAIDVYSSFRNRKKCLSDSCNGHRHGDYTEMNDHAEEKELLVDDLEQGQGQEQGRFMAFLSRLQCVLEHYVVKVVALLLQLGGLVGLIAFWAVKVLTAENLPAKKNVYMKPLIGLPLVLLSLSFIWSNRFQEAIAKPNLKLNKDKKVTARYKSSEDFWTL